MYEIKKKWKNKEYVKCYLVDNYRYEYEHFDIE